MRTGKGSLMTTSGRTLYPLSQMLTNFFTVRRRLDYLTILLLIKWLLVH